MVKVNMQKQELRTFDPVPPGTYRVVVDSCEERTSSTGNEGLFWLFRITDIISTRGSDDGVGLVDRTIPHGTQFQESSIWNLYRTLVALGEDPASLQDGEFEFEPDAMVGKECVVTTRLREYMGQQQVNISNLRALNEQEAGALA